jgi:hypothetical protein
MKQRNFRRMAAAAVTFALAGTGVGLGAGSASAATSYHISGWTTGSGCIGTGDFYCLWYFTGKGTGGYGWAGKATSTYNIPETTKFTISGSCPLGSGSACGEGDYVYNDAESMSNATSDCNVTVWEDYNNAGDADWLSPVQAGNLTATLSDHDESIDANSC